MIKQIKVGSDTHNITATQLPYGVCSTAADVAAKTVTVPVFTLETGATIIVKFTYANSVASPTLNVNSTGAKAIKRYGTTAVSTDTTTTGWVAGAVQMFTYDGTNWVRDYWNNTTYSTFKASGTNAAAGLVPKPSTAAGTAKYLREDATWANLPTATSSVLGMVKIGSNIDVSSGTISVPTADNDTAGVTVVYPAASCTTFSSDSGTVTPLAVQKGAKIFAITRPSSSTNKAITRYSNTTGDVQDSKIIIEDVTNTRDTSKTAQVIAIPAEGNKKMVYGYCTDQIDGTSFIGGVFDKDATTYPYASGLAIGGTSGNLLWKGNRVIDAGNISEYANKYTLPNATSSTLGGVKIGSNITVSSGTISLTKANVTSALGYTPPTSDTNTTYSQATSSTLGLVKIGYTASGKNYPVQLNSSGQMYVNVPWTDTNTNTTYSAGAGISLSGTTFSNSGVRNITASTANGGICFDLNGTTKEVFVYGLKSAAYTESSAYAPASHNHNASNINAGTLAAARLPLATTSAVGGVKVGSNITVSSGTISLTKANVTAALGYTPPTRDTNTTYSAGTGLTLSGTQFKLTNTYAGGTAVTLNGASKAASTASFYAPTTLKTTDDYFVVGGSSAPTWMHRAYVTASLYNKTADKFVTFVKDSSNGYMYFRTGDATTADAVDARLGSSTARWHTVYGKAGDFSGTVEAGKFMGPYYHDDGTGYVNITLSSSQYYFKPGTTSLKVNSGGSSYRWANVYSKTSLNVSSDIKIKKDLTRIDDRYVELFDLVQPYSYKFIDGTSGRTHTGFISQHVESAAKEVGLDPLELAFFCKDPMVEDKLDSDGNVIGTAPVLNENGEQEYFYSLRYEEYIAIMAEKIKRLEAQYNSKIEELEKRLQRLEEAK